MFTTSNHFIAQLIAALNRAGWSIESARGVCSDTDESRRFVTLDHSDGRTVDGLLIDIGDHGYRLFLDQDVITHAEVIAHVEYCATDHLPVIQAARSNL